MGWKEFLKPDWKKILFLIILIALVSLLPHYSKICGISPLDEEKFDCSYQRVDFGVGYPHFYGEYYSGDAIEIGFDFINLIINLVVYYILSCLIIFIYNKFKK